MVSSPQSLDPGLLCFLDSGQPWLVTIVRIRDDFDPLLKLVLVLPPPRSQADFSHPKFVPSLDCPCLFSFTQGGINITPTRTMLVVSKSDLSLSPTIDLESFGPLLPE